MIDALFALMLLLQATPAPDAAAQPQADAQVAEPAPAEEPAEDPMVCRNERVIGSNIPVRTCQRRSEMEARAERTGRLLRGRPGLASGRPVGTNLDD